MPKTWVLAFAFVRFVASQNTTLTPSSSPSAAPFSLLLPSFAPSSLYPFLASSSLPPSLTPSSLLPSLTPSLTPSSLLPLNPSVSSIAPSFTPSSSSSFSNTPSFAPSSLPSSFISSSLPTSSPSTPYTLSPSSSPTSSPSFSPTSSPSFTLSPTITTASFSPSLAPSTTTNISFFPTPRDSTNETTNETSAGGEEGEGGHGGKEPITLAHVAPIGQLSTWVVFFIVCIASAKLGGLVAYINLPQITGYMLIGVLCGPSVLSLIKPSDLTPLSLITQGALAFICLSAGAELYLPELRALFRQILWMTLVTGAVTFFACTLLIWGVASMLPFYATLPGACQVSVASITSAVVVSNSPASTIALVKEMKAKGPFVSAVMGVVVLGDVIVILLYAITTSLARTTCQNEAFDIVTLSVTLGTVAASILIGYLFGRLFILLFMFRAWVSHLLILPIGLMIFVFSHWLSEWSADTYANFTINLESLLICITAGYVCTNKSSYRHRLMNILETLGPKVFLPFFTLSGATLKVSVLLQSLGFALVICSFRLVTTFLGSSSGGYLAGIRPLKEKRNMLTWMALITQAGVSLGLAAEVAVIFPKWGQELQTALIAIILVNQIIGPILFRVAVKVIKEDNKQADEEERDEDAAIPMALMVGSTPAARAVTVRLLKAGWHVTMVCNTEKEANSVARDVMMYGQEIRGAHVGKKDLAGTLRSVAALPKRVMMDAATKTANRLAALNPVVPLPSHDSLPPPTEEMEDAMTPPASAVPSAIPAAIPPSTPPEVLLDHHGNPLPLLEAGFRAIVLELVHTDTKTTRRRVVKSAEGVQLVTAEGVITLSAPVDGKETPVEPVSLELSPMAKQFMSLIDTSEMKYLAAAVFALKGDRANFEAAQSMRLAIRSTSRAKHPRIQKVRLLAMLRSALWGTCFEAVGCMPLHSELHTAVVATRLLTSPVSKPLPLHPVGGLQDMCKSINEVLRAETMQSFASKFADPDGPDFDDIVAVAEAQLVAAPAPKMKPPKPTDLLQGLKLVKSKMPTTLSQVAGLVITAIEPAGYSSGELSALGKREQDPDREIIEEGADLDFSKEYM